MTVTLTQEHLYVGIIIVLIGIQIYQQKIIKKLEKEVDDIWSQMATLVANISIQLTASQKDKNDK
jgi:uncharacterized membrane protein YiaA